MKRNGFRNRLVKVCHGEDCDVKDEGEEIKKELLEEVWSRIR